MADIALDLQAGASVAGAGSGIIFIDSVAKILAMRADDGTYKASSKNAALATVFSGFNADLYVPGSDILIPSFGVQAKTLVRWQMTFDKSAGIAAPSYNVRVGSNRATTDASRVGLIGPAQTAVADAGTLTIVATVRSVGAAGAIEANAWWSHNVAAGGFANNGAGATSGAGSVAFDNSALGGQYIGLSINAGAAADWIMYQCTAEAQW